MFENEYCVRCGAGYKWEQMTSTPEGDLFCPTCWKQLEAKNEENKNEEKRKCPVEGAEMQKRLIAEAVLIDRCPVCGGVWLDKGELEVMQEKSKEDGWSDGVFFGMLFG